MVITKMLLARVVNNAGVQHLRDVILEVDARFYDLKHV